MIQHDQQSRLKAWMRMLAVDIRPISVSITTADVYRSAWITPPQHPVDALRLIVNRHRRRTIPRYPPVTRATRKTGTYSAILDGDD